MSSDFFNTYQCSHCQFKIEGLRVRCATCTDFEMCLQCFSHGAEIGPHRNDHPYQFVDSEVLDVFGDRSGWSALEELNLLDAVETYSYGNWKDIAQLVASRSADEAREEYVGRFLEGSIGQAMWPTVQHLRPTLRTMVGDGGGSLGPSDAPLDIRPQEAQHLYYYPLRDEFDIEYDNMAETLVSDLTLVNGEDDDLDIALKLTQIDMYTQSLRERARRHRVIRDYQLISAFFRHKEKKKVPKDERTLREQLLPFARFHTCAEHDRFIDCVASQRRLSRRLAELLRYHRFGITRIDELASFEKERLRHRPANTERGDQMSLEAKRRKMRRKKRLLFSAKKMHSTRWPFLKLSAHRVAVAARLY